MYHTHRDLKLLLKPVYASSSVADPENLVGGCF